jgi:hypothetical protein
MKRLTLFICALVLCLVILAGPAMAVLPLLDDCQPDIQGANDENAQVDLTQFCVEPGSGNIELYTAWDWDETALSGSNTGDGCSLYDTGGDGKVDLSICVSVVNTAGGNLKWKATTLYTCGNTKPDRCTSPIQIVPSTGTNCTVSQQDTDPFSSGDDYPADTVASCEIDLIDFGSAGNGATLIDVCSYPSGQPNSNPFDCILFSRCTEDSDCNDDNECTNDICDTSIHACRHLNYATGTLCDDQTDTDCDAPNTCDSVGFCQNNFDPAGTICRASSGVCDIAETCTGSSATCPTDIFKSNSNICRASSGVCDITETCTGSSATCPGDSKSTAVCRTTVDICDVSESCNGVNNDCPSDTFVTSGTQCRASAGVCDPAETCTGSSASCPADSKSTAVCRGSGGICDVPESCNGMNNNCPADTFVEAGSECRASGGVCDIHETCTGSSATCPVDAVLSSGTICNKGSDDICDPDETCNGSSKTCPADLFEDASYVCRTGSGDMCDPDEKCPGVADTACPNDIVVYTGSVCRAGSGDMCDPAEQCTGFVGQSCPTDIINSSETVCRAGSGDVCDPDEKCTGIAGRICPINIIKGTDFVCNAGSGDACDQDEKCPGIGGQKCPTDVFASSGTVCRTGSGDICNPEEVCSGVADQSCPTDVQLPPGTTCPTGECVDGQCVYVPPGGVLLPTQTTCQMYAAGPSAWPPMYEAFTYNVNAKTGQINGVSPGVIFYYNTIKAPSSSFGITVNETNNQSWKPMLAMQENKKVQAYLYDSNCHVVSTADRGFGSDPYRVEFSISGVTTGNTYYIGIKYTPQNLVHIMPDGKTSLYTWSTEIGGQSGDGTSIPVIPGKDSLALETVSSAPIYMKLS